MIIDACPLFNEIDLLELRMNELSTVVDRFVIAEATVTHKGEPKPLHFAEHRQRFAAWEDKIEYVIVADMPKGEGLAAIRRREMHQRNAILRGVRDCADDDIILISDCDELPRLQMIPRGIEDGVIATYLQRLYYYNLNTYAPDRPWPGTRACRVSDARALSPHIVRNGMGQPDAHYPHHVHVVNGGWHFSYFGGVEKIREKQTQFLHQELVDVHNTDPATIAARVASGVDIWGREHEQSFVIGPAADLPYTILRDLPEWSAHFHPDWRPIFHEDWYSGGQAIWMAARTQSAPEGAVVEIGAWEGRSTIVLAQMVAPRVVHVVDHWMGNPDEGAEHPATLAAQERDVYQDFEHNIKCCTPDNVLAYPSDWRDWVKGWWHVEPNDRRIAFLHLDASHDRASVRDCLEAIRPFLVDGAILCGDDAYDKQVIAGVRDVFPDAEVIGKRLWEVVYHAHD